ncbi:MAG: ROK family protein, partial [Candidatus Woesearchaeota archaeon]
MFFNEKKYYLVADVGGTKTAIAILDSEGNILIKKIYISREIKNFTDTLLQFMHQPECKQYKIKDSCIGVAGQVNAERNYARLTNLEWTIDVHNILIRTPLHKVILLNDFEAIGFGIDILKQENYIELTNIGRRPEGTIAVIGAGTGLGMSILTREGNKHFPIPSEGGHVSLPILSNDTLDLKLQSFLINKNRYKDAEDIVSGRGIVNIYDFLMTQKIKHNNKIKLLIKNSPNKEKPALITKYALEDRDALCMRTLELFIKYYSRIARNLALTTLCSEMIIAGGIAPKI